MLADEDDVFNLLAGSVCVREEEPVEEGIPPPFPPLSSAPTAERPSEGSSDVVVQTVLLDDVQMLKDERFNTQNHHEWAPFRDREDGSVLVDPAWWSSLVAEHRSAIEALVCVEQGAVEVPHRSEIKDGTGSAQVYRRYVDGFSFARWRTLKPDAVLVALCRHDRDVLELAARRHVLGGTSGLQSAELADISQTLLADLAAGIASFGGRAFAKTAEKSAKNDTVLKAHTTPLSILGELTTSADVLQQSLGKDARGDHRGCRYLVLQPWIDGISAANEFRVIVSAGRVVGITQQTWGRYVGHTAESAAAAVNPLLRLWSDLLPQCPYSECILDAYVLEGVAQLIEVNPCGLWGSSGSGLFHWVLDYDALFGGGPLPVRVVVESPDSHTIDVQAGLCDR